MYLGHNDTFLIIDLLLSISLFSPICLSYPLFFSLIKIIVSFSLSTKTYYQVSFCSQGVQPPIVDQGHAYVG